MLSQITWANYLFSVFLISALYYLFILSVYYRTDIAAFSKGKFLKAGDTHPGLLPSQPVAASTVMGKIQTFDAVVEEDYEFAPPEPDEWDTETDEPVTKATQSLPVVAGTQLVGQFSEMITEIRTLVRVVADSREPKENFEMLFTLIVQKFSMLRGTPYQQQVNEFLLTESKGQFPFELNETELDTYWTEE